MIRIGGTFPGECHLQESESDYCKGKVMTNNKSESYQIKPSGRMSSPRKWKWLLQTESESYQIKPSQENVISKKVKVITAKWKWWQTTK